MEETPDDWSAADNPEAIAVSEARWWLSAVQLAAARLQDRDDLRSMPVSSRQIDARQLIVALAQLLGAERLEQLALKGLDLNAAGHVLAEERSKYLDAVPGIQETRNVLTHFEDWSRGEGRGPQKRLVAAGADRRDVASKYWGFGYDPGTHSVRLGPYRIEVERAVVAAIRLHWAIYAAAQASDAGERQGPDDTSPSAWVRIKALSRKRAADLEIKSVPDGPGVYAWFRAGDPIYVGKASGSGGLRERLSKHLGMGLDLSRSSLRRNVAEHVLNIPTSLSRQRPSVITSQQVLTINEWIRDLEVTWLECPTPAEAVAFERELLREWMPPLSKR